MKSNVHFVVKAQNFVYNFYITVDFIFRCGAILGLTFGDLYSLICMPKKEVFLLFHAVMFKTSHIGYQGSTLKLQRRGRVRLYIPKQGSTRVSTTH